MQKEPCRRCKKNWDSYRSAEPKSFQDRIRLFKAVRFFSRLTETVDFCIKRSVWDLSDRNDRSYADRTISDLPQANG